MTRAKGRWRFDTIVAAAKMGKGTFLEGTVS